MKLLLDFKRKKKYPAKIALHFQDWNADIKQGMTISQITLCEGMSERDSINISHIDLSST